MWQKEEADTTIRLQKYLQGYPQTSKQKMEHLRENKSETNTGSPLTKPWANITPWLKGTQQLHNRYTAYTGVTKMTEPRPPTTTLYVSQTEDEIFSDKSEGSRQEPLGPGRRHSQFRKGTLGRIHHALGETCRKSNWSGKCKNLHSKFVSLLTGISWKPRIYYTSTDI